MSHIRSGLYYIIASILFILSGIPMSSCRNRQINPDEDHRFDSLLITSRDSIYHNFQLSYTLLQEAKKYVFDSTQYYRLQASLGKYYVFTGKLDSAFFMSSRAIAFANRQPDSPNKDRLLTESHMVLGDYYLQTGKIDSVLSHYEKTIQYLDKTTHKENLPTLYLNIGDIYVIKNDFVNSINYYQKALTTSDFLHLNSPDQKYTIYISLARAYLGLYNFDIADDYFRKAEKFIDEIDPYSQFFFHNYRGFYYVYQEKYTDALFHFRKAEKLTSVFKNEVMQYHCYGNIGDAYLHLNKQDSAQIYLNKSYHYFQKLNDYASTLYYLATGLANLALQQDDELTAQQLMEKHSDATFIEPEIRLARYKILKEYYYRTKNYKLAFDYQTKGMNLNDSIRSERIKSNIAEMNMRYDRDTTMMQLKFQIFAKDNDLKQIKMANSFYLLVACMIFTLATIGYLFLRHKRKLQDYSYSETISKIRLQNIRNRISPHFVFNILNRHTYSKDGKEENEELIELARLLRKSLEFTESIAISLSDEIDFVKSYLQLEKRNMEDDFVIIWNIDDSIHFSKWKIPAMILQIPIENAVKHALRGKQGKKILEICLTEKTEGLYIDIIDNGDGYLIHNKSPYKGTGTGLNVLYRTIQFLNRKNKHFITFNLINLSNSNENRTGTKAAIFIPTDYVY